VFPNTSDLLEVVWSPFVREGDSHLLKVALGISMLVDASHTIESFEVMVVVFKNVSKCINVQKLQEIIRSIDSSQVEREIQSKVCLFHDFNHT